MSETPTFVDFPASITFTPTDTALTFYGGDTRTWLTISCDGLMTIGPGLSEDEATQRVAKMLAENYSQLHKAQADEIQRLRAALSNPIHKQGE